MRTQQNCSALTISIPEHYLVYRAAKSHQRGYGSRISINREAMKRALVELKYYQYFTNVSVKLLFTTNHSGNSRSLFLSKR